MGWIVEVRERQMAKLPLIIDKIKIKTKKKVRRIALLYGRVFSTHWCLNVPSA